MSTKRTEPPSPSGPPRPNKMANTDSETAPPPPPAPVSHLLIKRLSEKAKLPTRGSALAAGYDLYSAEQKIIPARGKALVDTQISIAVPVGTYGRVAPRSGLASKFMIDTGAGVIDADYRGVVFVLLFNHSDKDFQVDEGDRVAQLIIEKIQTPEVMEVEDLEETLRGAGGFGSTGGHVEHRRPSELKPQADFINKSFSKDINYSGDGGLYAELLQNRAFQGQTPGTSAALYAWHTLGSATIAVVNNTAPVSRALPNSLSLTVGEGASGSVGFSNEGYWGIGITEGVAYNASFYAKLPAGSTLTAQDSLTVQLLSATGEALATDSVQGLSESWQQFSVRLTARKTPESAANRFAISVDGVGKGGEVIYFALLSLFPPTWNDRPNGLRKDIVQTLADAKPSFFRFPGGNNLEGEVVSQFWNWTNTVGPLVDRPGRFGDWTYWNTDGLGLLEYLLLCEDLGMASELIMGVYAGYSILGETVPESQLQPYIDLAISQIEFVMGDAETNQWAALRAKYGHPEPFKLEYVEIGNEDLYRTAPQSYLAYRWAAFANAISAKYPQLKLISSTNYGAALNPPAKYVDIHHYERPSYFINRYNMYDNRTLYPATVQIFEGEYAVIRNNAVSTRLQYPTLEAAVAEATFMAGMEKNSDLVFAAAYAPVLQHVNGTQWAPDMIAFDSYNIIKSASYWVQHMFSVNRGKTILSVQSTAKVNPIYWVASKTDTSAFVKLTNILNTTTTLTFNFPDLNIAPEASATILAHSDYNIMNTPANPNAVAPKEVPFAAGKTFSFDIPGQSVVVLKLALE